MGGKSSQSTQQIQIPPEVLARYNAVNARAEVAAATPFQQYSTDPSAFVAPLTQTQQAGVANTNYYSGAAQPYFAAATQQLGAAQQTALPFYGQAAQQVGQAQDVGNRLAGLSMESLYGGQRAADRPQQQAYDAYGQAYAGARPFQGAATGYALAGSQAVDPSRLGGQQINQYMSPYLANVLQGTAALQNQMNQQAMSGQTGNAIRQGAFGGDRAGIAAANLAQQQQLASNKTFADILNTGYGQALTTAQQQQQLGLSAAQANRAALQNAAQQFLGIGQQGYTQGMGYGQAQQGLGQQLFGQGLSAAQQQAALGQQQFGQGLSAAQQNAALGAGLYGMGSQTAQGLANLGTGAQAAGLQGAQAQLAAGQAQQQTEQAGLQALYNQFLQERSYPFQVAQFLGNIAMGTGALSGSTTQTNQSLSDKRLKENVKPIGKTFDGQNIYSYNFKGSPQTEIGLLAQEVEKHHPEAVGLAGGYRTVNYDKATDDAAERGHFASGGAASMGGGVMPYHGGEGFYDGGSVGFDPGLMQSILAAYQNMYAPMQGQKGGLSAASYVPEATAPVGQLMTAGALPDMPNPIASAKGIAELGTGLGELGGNLNLWDYTDEQRAETARKKRERAAGHAYGGLAAGRHGYEEGGETVNEIVVMGKRATPAPAPAPKQIEVPSATPAPAPLAPVAKVDTSKTVSKPSFQKVGLDIPQVANTVGLTPAAALTPLKDNTGDILSGIGSIGSAVGSIMAASDRRLKENIKPVGKTFDGQTVYSYNYKGEHQTRMGLIAQEVAKHHPQAVGHAGGYKTVDYKKATSAAAHRGHFAFGGEADEEATGAPGMDIPLQGNQVGLAAAPGLTPLKDSTGDILSGLGSIGQAAAKFAKKAEGGFLEGEGNPIRKYLRGKMNPLSMGDEPRSLDSSQFWGLGVRPEEEEMAPEQAMPAGLAAFERGAQGVRETLGEQRQPPAGLAAFERGAQGVRETLGEQRQPPAGLGAAVNQGPPKAVPTKGGVGVRSVRNNNPGNIEDGSFAKNLPGYAGSDGRFAIFENPDDGRSAQMALIRSYINRGFDTPYKIANRWAPPTEKGNDVPMYARMIAKMAGVGVHDRVSFEAIPHIANAQTIVEGGQRALQHFLPGKSEGGGLAGRPHKQDGGTFEEEFDETFAPNALREAIERGATAGEVARMGYSPAQTDYANSLLRKAADPTSSAGVAGASTATQVPAPTDATSSAGVAGASTATQAPTPTPKKRGLLGNIAHGDFVSGLGKGRATSWIPLLTGIGASMSGPYRGIVGLGQGIAAGAQARQAQYEFGRQLRETGALEKTAASTEYTSRTQRLEELRQQLDQAVKNYYVLPGSYERAVQLQKQLAALGVDVEIPPPPQVSAVGSPTPTGTPAATTAAPVAPLVTDADVAKAQDIIQNSSGKSLDEIQNLAVKLSATNPQLASALQSIVTTAINTGKRISGNDIVNVGIRASTERAMIEGSVEAAVETQNMLQKAVQASINSAPVLETLEQAAKGIPSSGLTVSATPIANSLNALAQYFGLQPVISQDKIGQVEEVNKAAATLAAQMADAFRGTAGAEVLSQLGATVPSANLSPQGIERLVGVLRQSMAAHKDQQQFINDYYAKHMDNPMAMRNAFIEYNKVRPASYWTKRAKYDYELSRAEKPILSPAQIEAIKAQGGKLNARINSKQTLQQWLDASFGAGAAQPIIDVLRDKGVL